MNEQTESRLPRELEELMPLIHAMCLGHVRNHPNASCLADELAQTVLIKAWKSFSDYRQDSKLSTWLYRIAVNTHLDFQRMEARVNSRLVPIESQEENTAFAINHSDEVYIDRLALQRLDQKLQGRDRVYFRMLCAGHSTREMSIILSIPEGTIKSQIHRLRPQMKQILHCGKRSN